MFYEGTEKRLLISTHSLNLFDYDDAFWQQLVAHSGAEILSTIRNSTLQAFLLSESSLFVWQDKLLLITCGNTQLVKAALFLQQQFTKQHIKSLAFQRHQALAPSLQDSNFEQDTILLAQQFHGQHHYWREDYAGDLFVFGEISTTTIIPHSIYMLHGLQGDFAAQLQAQTLSKQTILTALKVESFFKDLLIDHFSFHPKGYSLNAIIGGDYLTIHLTPEQLSTYLSIETSFPIEQCTDFISHLTHLFSPSKVKQMHFKPAQQQLSIIIN